MFCAMRRSLSASLGRQSTAERYLRPDQREPSFTIIANGAGAGRDTARDLTAAYVQPRYERACTQTE